MAGTTARPDGVGRLVCAAAVRGSRVVEIHERVACFPWSCREDRKGRFRNSRDGLGHKWFAGSRSFQNCLPRPLCPSRCGRRSGTRGFGYKSLCSPKEMESPRTKAGPDDDWGAKAARLPPRRQAEIVGQQRLEGAGGDEDLRPALAMRRCAMSRSRLRSGGTRARSISCAFSSAGEDLSGRANSMPSGSGKEFDGENVGRVRIHRAETPRRECRHGNKIFLVGGSRNGNPPMRDGRVICSRTRAPLP